MKSLSHTLIAAALALVLTFAVDGFIHLTFGRGLEAWTSDLMQTWRYDLRKHLVSGPRTDDRVVLAAIDRDTVNDLGRWPFPRAMHGQFFQVLAPQKPKVVALDALFSEKTAPSPASLAQAMNPPAPVAPPATGDTNSPAGATDPNAPGLTSPAAAITPPAPPTPPALEPDDEAIVDGAKLLPCLVTAAQGDDSSGLDLATVDTAPTKPLPNIVGEKEHILSFPRAQIPFTELRQVSTFGFADTAPDVQLRSLPLVVKIGKQVYPSFDLQVLMQYYGVDAGHVIVDLGHEITLAPPGAAATEIPVDDAGQFLVNYRARTGDFFGSGFGAMAKGLTDLANGRTSDERAHLPQLHDRIVVAGVTLSGTDTGTTPIESYSPLVIAHLNLLNNVLQGDYLHEAGAGAWMTIYLLFLFGLAFWMLRLGLAAMIPLALIAMIVWADISFGALWLGNRLIPAFAPELGIVALASLVPMRRFFGEERKKLLMQDVLRANLSDKVMDQMLEHPRNVELGGTKQEITVLFCDLRNFTAYCDQRDPHEVMESLNAYFEEMTQVIFRHDGTIDKYIGDGIMAFWNAPEPQPDHARRAVACALEMRQALAQFNAKRMDDAGTPFDCSIGIHTGEALVGNLGSSHKRSYTALGSTVNLAALIEGLTRQFNQPILVSREVARQLGADFPVKDLGPVPVKGLAEPVNLFAVGTGDDAPTSTKDKAQASANHPRETEPAREKRQAMWRLAPLDDDPIGGE